MPAFQRDTEVPLGLFDFFSKPPSKEKFARIVLTWMNKNSSAGELRYDEEKFALVATAADGLVFNLHNVYRDYCGAAKNERDAVLFKYASSLSAAEDTPADFAEASGYVRPILRSRAMLEALRPLPDADGKEHGRLPPSAPFSPDTLIMLAYDSEHAMRMVSVDDLAKWQRSFDDVLQVALTNLRDMTIPKYIDVIPGLVASDWNDYYDSSRILFSDTVFQAEVGGEPIVMIPNRHRMLVASANNKAALSAMLNLAARIVAEEGRHVSSLMYRIEQGKAVPYMPVDAELQAGLANFRRSYLNEDYASLKEQLDKRNEQLRIDVFIATYQVIEWSATGRAASMAVWTEGVDTLLPETELLALVAASTGGEPEHKFVTWTDAQSLGMFELAGDAYPSLFKPPPFPSPAQLAALPAVEL